MHTFLPPNMPKRLKRYRGASVYANKTATDTGSIYKTILYFEISRLIRIQVHANTHSAYWYREYAMAMHHNAQSMGNDINQKRIR